MKPIIIGIFTITILMPHYIQGKAQKFDSPTTEKEIKQAQKDAKDTQTLLGEIEADVKTAVTTTKDADNLVNTQRKAFTASLNGMITTVEGIIKEQKAQKAKFEAKQAGK